MFFFSKSKPVVTLLHCFFLLPGRGDHLATIYTDSLWSTADRRRHLKESKYFDCSCRRCADPTELVSDKGEMRK